MVSFCLWQILLVKYWFCLVCKCLGIVLEICEFFLVFGFGGYYDQGKSLYVFVFGFLRCSQKWRSWSQYYLGQGSRWQRSMSQDVCSIYWIMIFRVVRWVWRRGMFWRGGVQGFQFFFRGGFRRRVKTRVFLFLYSCWWVFCKLRGWQFWIWVVFSIFTCGFICCQISGGGMRLRCIGRY